MRLAKLSMLVLLALVAVAQAELKIVGETKVIPNKQVRLKLEGDTKDAFIVWDYDDSKVDPAIETDTELVFVAPPGTHSIRVRSFKTDKDGKKRVEKARVQVIVGNPTPPEIKSFSVTPATILKGERATISWSVFPADASVTLGSESVPSTGTQVVNPESTRTYALSATTGDGTTNAFVVLTVSEKPKEPDDALLAPLKAVFDSDPDPGKKAHAKALAAVYRQGVPHVSNPAYKTAGELLGKVAEVSGTLLPKEALKSTRTFLSRELRTLLPNPDAVLTPEQRTATAALFTRFTAILEYLGR